MRHTCVMAAPTAHQRAARRRLPFHRRTLLAAALGCAAGMAGVLVTGRASAQTASVAAEVTKIDKAAGRVTLKHGEVKALNMPPMTMAYKVRESRLLDDLVVGDRVRFVPERIDGQYTATALSKAP